MTHLDHTTITDRLERIARAIELGCVAADTAPRSSVQHALVDTVWEAVALGHQLTRDVAYDDLWSELDGLLARWDQIRGCAEAVALIDGAVIAAAVAAADTVETLTVLRDAIDTIDNTQLVLAARPGEQPATIQLMSAMAALESAGDRAFVAALGNDVLGRLDAAMALLTTCAARASRERTIARTRRR